jgi:GTPase SAR1 family protein
VGKTAIHTRFIHQSFASQWSHTIGVEFGIRTIELGGRRLKLQGWALPPPIFSSDRIGPERTTLVVLCAHKRSWCLVMHAVWDTAGPERFRPTIRSYYRGACGMLVVYDITSRQSWENVKRWVEDVRRTLPDQMIPFIVGTCALASPPRRLHSQEPWRACATESLTPVPSSRCSGGKERLDFAQAGVC